MSSPLLGTGTVPPTRGIGARTTLAGLATLASRTTWPVARLAGRRTGPQATRGTAGAGPDLVPDYPESSSPLAQYSHPVAGREQRPADYPESTSPLARYSHPDPVTYRDFPQARGGVQDYQRDLSELAPPVPAPALQPEFQPEPRSPAAAAPAAAPRPGRAAEPDAGPVDDAGPVRV